MNSLAPNMSFGLSGHASQDVSLELDGLVAAATTSTADRGGALDALANYWITKILHEDANNEIGVPEYNLNYSASEAFFTYLNGRDMPASTAFDLAMRIAGIVERRPLDAADEIRTALETTVKDACGSEALGNRQGVPASSDDDLREKFGSAIDERSIEPFSVH